jgi:hypothetical protein
MTGLCDRTVRTAIAELEELGYVRRLHPRLLVLALEDVDRGKEEASEGGSGGAEQASKNQAVGRIGKFLRRYILTKEEESKNNISTVLAKIGRVQRIKIPETAYLYARAEAVRRVTNTLKLNYAKVVLALLLAEYYKALNADYMITYTAAWIAKVASLPDEEIKVPGPAFVRFLEERLDEFRDVAPTLFDTPAPKASAQSRSSPQKKGRSDTPVVSLPKIPASGDGGSDDGEPPPQRRSRPKAKRRAYATNRQMYLGEPVAYCPRCGERIPDYVEDLMEHGKRCPMRPGKPIGRLCGECGRFVMDHPDDRAMHDSSCNPFGLLCPYCARHVSECRCRRGR